LKKVRIVNIQDEITARDVLNNSEKGVIDYKVKEEEIEEYF
jgi:hypothetical protein